MQLIAHMHFSTLAVSMVCLSRSGVSLAATTEFALNESAPPRVVETLSVIAVLSAIYIKSELFLKTGFCRYIALL